MHILREVITMPRPMLKRPDTQTQSKQDSLLSASYKPKSSVQTNQNNKMALDRLLRKPRSKAYIESMTKLDAGGHVNNKAKADKIIEAIKQEFPEVEITGIMLGIVSKCYLGNPYEVHTLDIACSIIEHYKIGHTLPGGLEKARSLAIRGGYEFIEVYVDCCRAVSSNGSVSVINY